MLKWLESMRFIIHHWRPSQSPIVLQRLEEERFMNVPLWQQQLFQRGLKARKTASSKTVTNCEPSTGFNKQCIQDLSIFVYDESLGNLLWVKRIINTSENKTKRNDFSELRMLVIKDENYWVEFRIIVVQQSCWLIMFFIWCWWCRWWDCYLLVVFSDIRRIKTMLFSLAVLLLFAWASH